MPIGSAPPPPPRKTATTSKPTPPRPADKTTERSEGLQGYGQLIQAGLIGFRQYADAGALGLYFPSIADEVAKLAAIDERVASVVDPIIQGGPYTALIAAVLPMAMQLAVNHGRVKPGAMGTVPRETLSARIEANLARMQAQALREQQAAEAEAERLQEEIRQTHSVIPSRTVG